LESRHADLRTLAFRFEKRDTRLLFAFNFGFQWVLGVDLIIPEVLLPSCSLDSLSSLHRPTLWRLFELYFVLIVGVHFPLGLERKFPEVLLPSH